MIVLSVFFLLMSTFVLGGPVFADDDGADNRDGATFDDTLVLELPELTVEGTDLLYSAKLQLKQEGDEYFMELISLGPCKYQEASMAAATLSNDGVLHVPLFNCGGKFFTIDLRWNVSSSLLPITFALDLDTFAEIPLGTSSDDLLGAMKKTCITLCTPWGCFSICKTTDDGKEELEPFKY